MKFKRILLKLSGEALMGEQKRGIDPLVVNMIANQVKAIRELGVEISFAWPRFRSAFVTDWEREGWL